MGGGGHLLYSKLVAGPNETKPGHMDCQEEHPAVASRPRVRMIDVSDRFQHDDLPFLVLVSARGTLPHFKR